MIRRALRSQRGKALGLLATLLPPRSARNRPAPLPPGPAPPAPRRQARPLTPPIVSARVLTGQGLFANDSHWCAARPNQQRMRRKGKDTRGIHKVQRLPGELRFSSWEHCGHCPDPTPVVVHCRLPAPKTPSEMSPTTTAWHKLPGHPWREIWKR